MSKTNDAWAPTTDSVRVMEGAADSHRGANSFNKLPAPFDQMILRALLSQPILTPEERAAAAEKAARASNSTPYTLTKRTA